MPFKGVLKQAVAFTVDVDNTGNPSTKVAVTILKINRRDKINSADHMTVAGGQLQQITDTAGPRIERVLIFVNPADGTAAPVTVNQSTLGAFNDPGDRDTCLVFDAEP